MAMAAAPATRPTFLTGSPVMPLLPCSLPPRKPRAAGSKLPCIASAEKSGMNVAGLAVAVLAAGALALGSVGDAVAAKSGGRVGGQAFRSAAPRPSGPRINNSRTNIYINPPVAPPLVGGYGYGGYGGWGWSPFSYFVPGPTVAVGVGGAGGFEFFVTLVVLGAVAGAVRRFFGGRRDDEGDDDY